MTTWRAIEVHCAAGPSSMVLIAYAVNWVGLRDPHSTCPESLWQSDGCTAALLMAVASRRGNHRQATLFVIELAVAIIQAFKAQAALVFITAVRMHHKRTPEHAGLWGLARSIRKEHWFLPMICIDGLAERAIKRPLPLTEPEVGLCHHTFPVVPRLNKAPPMSNEPRIAQAHLLTGGTGSLGLLVARWLAHQGALLLMLASRSGTIESCAEREWLQLQATSAAAYHLPCDVAEKLHIRRAVASNVWAHYSVGVWHTAGTLADDLLVKQSALPIRHVYAPKAYGAWTLHQGFALMSLSMCVLFSSVASLLGFAGQTNYSAASSCLDTIASQLRASSHMAACVQWGPWAHMGMAVRGVASASARVAALEKSLGISTIGLAQGLDALQVVVHLQGPPCTAVVPVSWHCAPHGVSLPALLVDITSNANMNSKSAQSTMVQQTTYTISLGKVLESLRCSSGITIDADAPLMEAGLDSLSTLELRNTLQHAVGDTISVSSTLIFEHPTARQVTRHLNGTCNATESAPTAVHGTCRASLKSTSRLLEIKVSGQGLVVPGAVCNLASLCTMSFCGRNMLRLVPVTRWDMAQTARQLQEHPLAVASRVRHGGFMCDVEFFDHRFFAISTVEASSMDPQQRLLLEVGYLALHAGGLAKSALLGADVAVNVGQWASEFGSVFLCEGATLNVYASTSFSCSVTCGRIPFVLGLHGPCSSYDTACSSSLVANHSSLRALQLAECNDALSAGVNLLIDPGFMLMNAVAGFTSVRGRCHTFDKRADGYARGESINAITYCSVSNVEDVLLGSAVRQDGRSASLTAPNGQAQHGVIMASLKDAQLAGSQMSVLEAHGTGTALGDPVELGALSMFLRQRPTSPLAVGSLKANVGHTEPASGLAGMLKLLTQLHTPAMSQNAQLQTLNIHVRASLHDIFACALPAQTVQLPVSACRGTLSGGVSSFGYSGTISHVVLGCTRHMAIDHTQLPKGSHLLSHPRMVYRGRMAFQWRQVVRSSITRNGIYAWCWNLVHPAPAVPPPPCLLVGTQSIALADEQLMQQVASPACVVALLTKPDNEAPSLRGTHVVVAIVQQLARSVRPLRILVLTFGVHAVCSSASCPANGGAWGLTRVIRLEHPGLWTQNTDAPNGRILPLSLSVLNETEVAWRHRGYAVMRLRAALPLSRKAQQQPSVIGVYVITGGLGGLGMCAATLLTKKGASHVLLASRGSRIRLNSLAAYAVKTSVTVLAFDSSDSLDAISLMSGSRVTGVLHAAGVGAKGLLMDVEARKMQWTHASKASGAWHLKCTTPTTSLDACILFSSVGSGLGNVGQAAYAAANACLDAWALSHRGQGQTACSIQWPLVRSSGMGLAAFPAGSERLVAVAGMASISLEDYADVVAMQLVASVSVRGCVQLFHRSDTRQLKCDLADPTQLRFSELVPERTFKGLDSFSNSPATGLAMHFGPSLQCQTLIEAATLRVVRELIGSQSAPLTADTPLMEAGIDSLAATELSLRLRTLLEIDLSPTIVFEQPTCRAIAAHINKHATGSKVQNTVACTANASTILDLGLGSIFGQWPGGCDVESTRSHLLRASGNALSSVPVTRWSCAHHVNSKVLNSTEVCVRFGGFVTRAQYFDAHFFGISSMEANVMDPQQRLLLECGYQSLHGATARRSGLTGSGIGVFLGIERPDWVVAQPPLARASVHAVTCDLVSVAAGRLSFVLGLHGPCFSIDTACSSALVAMHSAGLANRGAECDGALALSVSLKLSPSGALLAASAGMLSTDGRCKTFDRRANGYARSEGMGVGMMRKLCSDDHLLIMGSATRQDGRSASLTAPNGSAQSVLLSVVLDNAAIASDKMKKFELHGTGTALGDPTEVGALISAHNTCVTIAMIGAVKASAGHSEAASGQIGLLKVHLLHKEAAGNAMLHELNPLIQQQLESSAIPFAWPVQACLAEETPTGISSFGFSGTIAHVTSRRLNLCWDTAVFTVPYPLKFARRGFHWRDTKTYWQTYSWRDQANASHAAQIALDAVVHCAGSMPSRAEVGIVGAGLAGLVVAAEFRKAGVRMLAVLEKGAVVGGTWRLYGNATSRVNTSEPAYRLEVPRSHPNTNHSHRSEILKDTTRLIEQHALVECIHTHSEVNCASSTTNGWLLCGWRAQVAFALPCLRVVLCTNRRLGRPRQMHLPGEQTFRGMVLRGIGGDVDELQCRGTRVAILGMGAFAIENMRTALERGARHVGLLCRRRGSVCPQIVDWINFIRPFNSEGMHGREGDAVVLAHWQRAYNLSGAAPPECWQEGMLKPDGHTVSTSDMFFVAHHMQMLTTQLGRAKCLNARSIVVSSSKRVDADVLIKCVGFEINEQNEKILGRASMCSTGLVSANLWLQVEAHLDSRAFHNPFGSSYLNYVKFNATTIIHYRQDSHLQALASARINHFSVTESLQGLRGVPQTLGRLTTHLETVTAAFHETMSPAEYVLRNQNLWDAINDLLLSQSPKCAKVAFPFAEIFEELPDLPIRCQVVQRSPIDNRIANRTVLESSSHGSVLTRSTCTLDVVLQVAQQLVGSWSLNPDTPLMDGGLDSLNVTELRSLLQAITSTEQPATLVFEAPTARLLVEAVSRRNLSVQCTPPVTSDRPVTLGHFALRLPMGTNGAMAAAHVAASSSDLLSVVPTARWIPDDAAITAAAFTVEQQAGMRHGGFVTGVQQFNNLFFSISASEAEAIDPQQRLLLEYGHEAFHLAQVQQEHSFGSHVGVIIGMEYFDFCHVVNESPLRSSVFAANSGGVAAGRASFVLGLHGPCMLVGATCASGLVAVSVASNTIAVDGCPAAIAAAISLILRPFGHIMHTRTGGLSQKGRCHTFDARADGFARSEAVFATVLRPDVVGNKVVIASQPVYSDGRSASLTAPNGQSQRAMFSHALALAGFTPNGLHCYEAHGTGTALGDPTEVSSAAAVLLELRGQPSTLGSFKGNIAHVEPAAGLAGLLLLQCALLAGRATPNAQLRAMNRYVRETLRTVASGVITQGVLLQQPVSLSGGVSSLGINGTIAHTMLRVLAGAGFAAIVRGYFVYHRRPFSWMETPNPLLATKLTNSDPVVTFRTSASGPLRTLVSDHCIFGHIIFPGAGYVEMARGIASTHDAGVLLRDVIFLQPLRLDEVEPAGWIECALSATQRFDVRSGAHAGGILLDTSTHSTGTADPMSMRLWPSCNIAAHRIIAMHPALVTVLYDSFWATGMQYGPVHRMLQRSWYLSGGAAWTARLHNRLDRVGTGLHPADLDAGMQLPIAVAQHRGQVQTVLPFAIDEAHVRCSTGEMWANVQGGEGAMRLVIDAPSTPVVRYYGFKGRTLSEDASAGSVRHHMYVLEWTNVAQTGVASPQALLLCTVSAGAGMRSRTAAQLERYLTTGPAAVILAMDWGSLHLEATSRLLCALTYIQTLAVASTPRHFVLLSKGAQLLYPTDVAQPLHAVGWGLLRTAHREEPTLPLCCIDAVDTGRSLASPHNFVNRLEPELAARRVKLHVSRLCRTPAAINAASFQLSLHARGAIRCLQVVPLDVTCTLGPGMAELTVRAVGLNFRDVLNVLGQYPGDPGPPGSDCSGRIISLLGSKLAVGECAFGLVCAPLASVARTDAHLLAPMPSELSFENACTLPITWVTMHVAFGKAQLSCRKRLCVHAGAGGVGLTSVEGAQWLCSMIVSSVGRMHKHLQLHTLGVLLLSSSRDSGACAHGVARRLICSRLHTVLNSLSTDFIASSLALLSEVGHFEEIGKRDVWSVARHSAATGAAGFDAIATDMATTEKPAWMGQNLHLLARRVAAGVTHGLPSVKYDMRHGYEAAFRILQAGSNVGKVVLTVPSVADTSPRETEVLTGGTGGLGLLTARWLLQRGAHQMVLTSRNGAPLGTCRQIDELYDSGACLRFVRCDMANDLEVHRLLAGVESTHALGGVWHASGILADAMLAKQDSDRLRRVYSPKVGGLCTLQCDLSATSLRTFVLFSSASALLGSAGQTNYSAANCCLDAIASHRRASSQVAASVQWAPWAEVGLALGRVTTGRASDMGIELLQPADGLHALHMAAYVSDTPTVVAIVPARWDRVFASGMPVPPMLSALASRQPEEEGLSVHPVISLDSVLDVAQRMVDNAIDVDAPLMDSGIDSLGAVELRNMLQNMAGATHVLPHTIVFDQPTVRQLVSYLAPSQVKSCLHQPVVDCAAIARAPLGPFRDEGLLDPYDSIACGPNLVSFRKGWPGAGHASGDEATGLFILHMPDGMVSLFSTVATALEGRTGVWGIEHAIIRSGQQHDLALESIEALGAAYAELILRVCGKGRGFGTIGASVGGSLAFCTARSAQQHGGQLKLLILVDPAPRLKPNLSYLEWRRIAAATLLTRIRMVLGVFGEDSEQDVFANLAPDEINANLAHEFMRAGILNHSFHSVVHASRRLDAWVHSARLTANWGTYGQMAPDVVCMLGASLIVMSSERNFVSVGEDWWWSTAQTYCAQVIVYPGSHLQVMSDCATGKNAQFVAEALAFVDSMLQDESEP